MTGRRLYDHYCDATAYVGCFLFAQDKTALAHPDRPAVAWPFLNDRDRKVWNNLARRTATKKPVQR